MRGMVLLWVGLLLSGCMATMAPMSDANFTARDKKLLANPPYERASIPPVYQLRSSNFTGRKRQALS